MIIIAVVMLNFMIDHKSMFWFTVVAGFLVDSYYSGVLGVYMALFAVIVRIIRLVRSNILQKSIYIRACTCILLKLHRSLCLLRVCLTRGGSMDWNEFLVVRLWATLMLNIVIYYILYLPLRNFARWVNSTPVVSPHDLMNHRRI